jgi:hypothetical protein
MAIHISPLLRAFTDFSVPDGRDVDDDSAFAAIVLAP